MIEYKCINYNEKSDEYFLCDSYGRSEYIKTEDCYLFKESKLVLELKKEMEKWEKK